MTLETAQAWALLIGTMSSGVAAIIAAVNTRRTRADLKPPSSEKTAGALLEQTATMAGTAALSIEGAVVPGIEHLQRTADHTGTKVDEIHTATNGGNV